MRTISELKTTAKSNFEWKYAGILLLFALFTSAFNIFLITIPLQVGLCVIALNISRGEDYSLSTIFKGFKIESLVYAVALLFIVFMIILPPFVIAFLALQLTSIGLLLFTPIALLLSLVILSVFSTYASLAGLILADDTNIGGLDAIKLSCKMMKGNFFRFIWLNITFIPWFILSFFTFFTLLIWVIPYMNLTITEFYLDLKENLDNSEF